MKYSNLQFLNKPNQNEELSKHTNQTGSNGFVAIDGSLGLRSVNSPSENHGHGLC